MGRLDDQYALMVKRIRARVEGFVTSQWGGLGSWRDGDVDRFVEAVVPVVAAGQRQVATLTDAYLSRVLSDRLGRRVPPVGGPERFTGAAVRRGAEPEMVYRRPFHTAWTALSEGHNLTESLRRGEKRLTELTATDLQLAKTHTSREVYGKVPEVVGYRRVLVGPENCAMCVIASTQRYHKEDLLPCHPGCNCDVAEILGTDDPGQVIDPETLEKAHSVVEEQFGQMDFGGRAPDYRKLITVEDHAEHGPTLRLAAHKFTDVDDVRRAADRGIPRYERDS